MTAAKHTDVTGASIPESIVSDAPGSHHPWGLSSDTSARVMRWVLVLGVIVRLVAIQWPADYHMLNSWRESDYTQIARSFYREGMNILYPRIDWRGNTTGFVEMEFPVIPWTAAALYHMFGYHEQLLRLLSGLASIGALFAFRRLATRLLRPAAALVATTAFTFNGLVVSLSWCIQPESLLLLLTILTAGTMLRWQKEGSPRVFLTACGFMAAAILVKSPAAHLGFLMAFLVLKKKRWATFRDPIVYLGIAISLLPGLLWYWWAHHHYEATGLSMGVSNEMHFMNLQVLRDLGPFLVGNAFFESLDSYGFFGLILAAGLVLIRMRIGTFPLAWYGSVLLFYIVIADTSGDGWAYYYHSIGAAPAALLVAVGSVSLLKKLAGANHRIVHWLPARDIVGFLIGAMLLVFSIRGLYFWGRLSSDRDARKYACMQQLSKAIPADEQIIVRGGAKRDEHGHEVAYNASYPFAWMDRKGLNYPREDFSLEFIERTGRGGPRYWVAGPSDLAGSDVRAEALKRFKLVSQCGVYLLFDIREQKLQ